MRPGLLFLRASGTISKNFSARDRPIAESIELGPAKARDLARRTISVRALRKGLTLRLRAKRARHDECETSRPRSVERRPGANWSNCARRHDKSAAGWAGKDATHSAVVARGSSSVE